MLHWLQVNIIVIIAFLTLIIALVSLAFSAWRYNNIRREELKQKRFTNYHNLIHKLVAGQPEEKFPRLDSQVAIIYELRNYPEYREVTIRILEDLCQYWTKFKESDKETEYARLLNEVPLTLSQLQEDDSIINCKKGLSRIVWVLAVISAAGGAFLFFVLGDLLGMYHTRWTWLMFSFLGAPIGYCAVWLIYHLFEWIVLGFYDKKLKDEQKK